MSYGAFLYPDLETAILGRFSGRLLAKGWEAQVTEIICAKSGLPLLQFQGQFGDPWPSYRYSPPNHYFLGDQPDLGDPYEAKNIEVNFTKLIFKLCIFALDISVLL